nr:MAG TPA: hypothetical protein [Bacteriophage sp.]
MEYMKTKNDLLDKLRVYNDAPDDDNIVYKQKIKKSLLTNPCLLYALNEKSLESELFDKDGNINWELNADSKCYEPLGEWDRYFGDTSNIRPFLFVPDTQTDVKHYICYQVGFAEIPRGSKIYKYTQITFTIFIHGQDQIDKLTGIARHDLIASILRENFNWSSIFGFQTELVSSKESITDNNYITRTLVFQIYDTNGMVYTPYNKNSYIRNNDYWQ